MKKICPICGHDGEAVWRGGRYYCEICGSEIAVSQQDRTAGDGTSTAVYVDAVCPVCTNGENNILKDGECRCSLCGTVIPIQTRVQFDFSAYSNSGYSAKREELEKKKKKRLIWGIVWLVLCWPVSIYHFYKMSQISEEIKRLYS
jgi:transposase